MQHGRLIQIRALIWRAREARVNLTRRIIAFPGYAWPDVEVFNDLILNLEQNAHQIEIELERQSRIIY